MWNVEQFYAKPAVEIIKGVPMPEGRSDSKWQFHRLEVGDCVVVEAAKARTARNCAYAHAEAFGKKFKTRKLQDGTVGIWRVE